MYTLYTLYKHKIQKHLQTWSLPLRLGMISLLLLVSGVANTFFFIMIQLYLQFPSFFMFHKLFFILLLFFQLFSVTFALVLSILYIAISFFNVKEIYFRSFLLILGIAICFVMSLFMYFDGTILLTFIRYFIYVVFAIYWKIPLLFVILLIFLRSLLFFFLQTMDAKMLIYFSIGILCPLICFFGFSFLKRVLYSALILIGISLTSLFLSDIIYYLLTLSILYNSKSISSNWKTVIVVISTSVITYDFLVFIGHTYFGLPIKEPSEEDGYNARAMFPSFVKIAKTGSEKIVLATAATEIQKADYSILTMKPEYKAELERTHSPATTGIDVNKLAETHPLYVKTEDLEAMKEKQEGSVTAHVLSSNKEVQEIRDDSLAVVATKKEAVYCVSDGSKGHKSYFTGQSMELSYEESQYFEEKPKQKAFESIFQPELQAGATKVMEKHSAQSKDVHMSDFTERRSTHNKYKK